jgi:hypothetical protein
MSCVLHYTKVALALQMPIVPGTFPQALSSSPHRDYIQKERSIQTCAGAAGGYRRRPGQPSCPARLGHRNIT